MGSLGDLIERTSPDVICLKQNPLGRDTIVESQVRYRAFSSFQQRARFERDYTYADLGSKICPHVFIRE